MPEHALRFECRNAGDPATGPCDGVADEPGGLCELCAALEEMVAVMPVAPGRRIFILMGGQPTH